MTQWNPTNRIAAPIEADIPPEYITGEELDACSYVTALTKAAGVTWPTGISGIPSGWTVNEI